MLLNTEIKKISNKFVFTERHNYLGETEQTQLWRPMSCTSDFLSIGLCGVAFNHSRTLEDVTLRMLLDRKWLPHVKR